MLNDKILAAAKVEADRQKCDEAGYQRLLSAYEYSWAFAKGKTRRPFVKWLLEAAWILEPQLNQNGFRTTPVTFDGGGWADPADSVPRGTETIFSVLDSMVCSGEWDDDLTEVFIKAFLVIHPFRDGNGRLAFIMRVWLRNEWVDPSPLPVYSFT